MDNKKDNFENNGNINGHQFGKNIVNSAYSGTQGAVSLMSIISKTKKIVTALYMVTDCLADTEPMRTSLRDIGVDMVLIAEEIIPAYQLEKAQIFAELAYKIEQAKSLIQVGGAVGMISAMNSRILISELALVAQAIRTQAGANTTAGFQSELFEGKSYANFTLSSDFFNEETDAEHTLPQPAQGSYKGHENTKGHIKNVSDTIQPLQTKGQNTGFKNKGKKADIGLKIARRNSILAIIKDKKEVTIKDIVNLVKDVSEKTIQRELLTLVSEGVLKKEGDKRWSRYSIAS